MQMKPRQARSQTGSAMAFVLIIVAVLGVAATHLISAVNDEMMASGRRQARIQATYAADSALELAKGRLRIKANRATWENQLFTSNGLAGPFVVEGITVSARLTTASQPYSDSFPVARIEATAGLGQTSVTVYQDVKESNTTDFAQWWRMGTRNNTSNGFFMNQPAKLRVQPMKGKIFIDLSTPGQSDGIDFIAPAAGVAGPYFEGEIVLGGAWGQAGARAWYTNSSGLPDAVAFPGGIRSQVEGEELPVVDSDVLRAVRAINPAELMVLTVSDTTHTTQIRLRGGNLFEYRIVADPLADSQSVGNSWIGPFSLSSLKAIVVEGYLQSNVAPRDTVILGPGTGTGGVQVWCDSRALPWEPWCERNPADAALRGWPVALDGTAAYTAFGGTGIPVQVTIASSGNLEVMGSLRYGDSYLNYDADGKRIGVEGGDLLGLIAQSSLWIRNDSLNHATGGSPSLVASDRVQYLDAFTVTGLGAITPTYNWQTGLESSMAPPLHRFGATVEADALPATFIQSYIIAWTTGTAPGGYYYDVGRGGWAGSGYKCWGFQQHEILLDPVNDGWPDGYDPNFTYDARGLKEVPPGFPKVLNADAQPIQGTWGAR